MLCNSFPNVGHTNTIHEWSLLHNRNERGRRGEGEGGVPTSLPQNKKQNKNATQNTSFP